MKNSRRNNDTKYTSFERKLEYKMNINMTYTKVNVKLHTLMHTLAPCTKESEMLQMDI